MSHEYLWESTDNLPELEKEALAWESKPNNEELKVDWQFTTARSSVKLKKLYSSID